VRSKENVDNMYHIFLSPYLSSDHRVDVRFLFIRVSFYNTISSFSLYSTR
jgi:hypothetical protein